MKLCIMNKFGADLRDKADLRHIANLKAYCQP